uniref:Uncharacterized protein n=1 Tax=Ananas comosus var. bracteatus TaxID=296719 RepID=A0A6V7PHG5_ANACO|nr:unnamed protein product [Ananas comosus var. bracteatus]
MDAALSRPVRKAPRSRSTYTSYCMIPGVQLWRLVDSSVECRDKPESRWRQIDAKRTPCDARAAFSEEICKIAVFLLAVPVEVELGWSWSIVDVAPRSRSSLLFPASTIGVPAHSRRRSVGLQRDLVRWIQDFERNPRSPYLPNLVKVNLVVSLFFSAAVALGRFEGHYGFLCCSGLLGAVGVDGGPVSPFWRRIVPRARDLLVVRPVRVGYLTLACESSTNLTETLVNSVGSRPECHSGMRFQCDECRSFCWTVLEPATLGVVYGAARYRQGGFVLGSPGEIVSDVFPYLLVRL